MKRFMLMIVVLVLSTACTSAPTPTPVPPTIAPTSIPPTATLVPPSATAIPPTATLIPATATAIPPTATPQAIKKITLIFVEGDNPVPGKEVWLSYYDENTKLWITKKETADKDGAATFSVPAGKSGESFVFAYGFSEVDVNTRINSIKGGGTGMRIPPDPTQLGLSLRFDLKSGVVRTGGGSLQMWALK